MNSALHVAEVLWTFRFSSGPLRRLEIAYCFSLENKTVLIRGKRILLSVGIQVLMLLFVSVLLVVIV